MFRREAVWLEFAQSGTAFSLGKTGPAVKISVGGQVMRFAEN